MSLLIHSYIYYHLDDNLIPDDQWTNKALELIELQSLGYDNDYEKDNFKDFKTPSGFNFKYSEQIKEKARYLLRNKDNHVE